MVVNHLSHSSGMTGPPVEGRPTRYLSAIYLIASAANMLPLHRLTRRFQRLSACREILSFLLNPLCLGPQFPPLLHRLRSEVHVTGWQSSHRSRAQGLKLLSMKAM